MNSTDSAVASWTDGTCPCQLACKHAVQTSWFQLHASSKERKVQMDNVTAVVNQRVGMDLLPNYADEERFMEA